MIMYEQMEETMTMFQIISTIIGFVVSMGLIHIFYHEGYHRGYKHGYEDGKRENKPEEKINSTICHIAKQITGNDYYKARFVEVKGKVVKLNCYQLRSDKTCTLLNTECPLLSNIDK